MVFLKRNNTNLYSLGHKIFEFGDKSDHLKTLTNLCLDSIRKLSIETEHITYLAVLEGPHVLAQAVEESVLADDRIEHADH